MEPIKGSPLYYGHRAFGSLAKYIVFMMLLGGLYGYLYVYYIGILHAEITVYGYHILVEYIIWFVMFVLFLWILILHYRWTYIITTRQIYVKKGIIASNVRNFLYDQIQEASSFQTIGQRFLMWGQLNVTMLITFTGQAKVEEAHMEFIHRPKHIANLMMSEVRIGDR